MKEGPYRESLSENEKREMKVRMLSDRIRELIQTPEGLSDVSGEDANLLDQVKIYLEASSKGKVSKQWVERLASYVEEDLDADVFSKAISNLNEKEKQVILDGWVLDI